jgi:glycosyltransferase involved in cell wall biosynthesis
LFVIPGDGQGHSMIFARRQAEALASREIAIELFHLRSRTSPIELWREGLRLRRMLREFEPDLVHAHFGTVTGLFTVLASRPIPAVVTYRGSDLNDVPTTAGPRAWLGRILSQLAMLGVAGAVCVSPQLRSRLWWRRSLVRVVPSGVDTNVFCPQPRDEARRALGWPVDRPVVLFNLGRGGANKRLDLAQAAMELVRAEIPDATLEVLDGNVPPAMIPLWMNAADCLLLTSDAEGSPTVIQEALATNLPVVSVATGDVAYRLCGVAASHIVPRDPGSLANAVIGVLQDEKRSDGRAHVAAVSSENVTTQLIELYRDVTAGVAPAKSLTWNITCSSPR